MQIFSYVQFLFFLHECENLGEKYRHDAYDKEEYELARGREKDSRNPEYCGERKYDCTNLILAESEFHKSEMKMRWLFSLHRVLSCEYARCYNIDKIYEVYPKYTHRCCYLSASDDGECRYQKGEHNSTRVTHDNLPFYICVCQKKCSRNQNRENRQKKSTIFFACYGCIDHIELECESCENDKWYQRKTTRKTRNSIRKIHRIKYENIPENSHKNREKIYLYTISKSIKLECQIIYGENTTWYKMRYIRDFYTGESDNRPHTYLHQKSRYRWNTYTTFSDSIEIIDKRYQRDTNPDNQHDSESSFEKGSKTSKYIDEWCENEQRQKNRYTCSIWCGSSSFFCFVEVWSIEKSETSKDKRNSSKYQWWDDEWYEKKYDTFEDWRHRKVYYLWGFGYFVSISFCFSRI